MNACTPAKLRGNLACLALLAVLAWPAAGQTPPAGAPRERPAKAQATASTDAKPERQQRPPNGWQRQLKATAYPASRSSGATKHLSGTETGLGCANAE